MITTRTGTWLMGFCVALFAVPLMLPAKTKPSTAEEDWSHLVEGKDVFLAACATCHGTDGRGADPSTVGFDIPLPDFTDCSFSSREPAGDWEGVAYEGGPTRGFDTMMPSFGEALTVEQLQAAVSHIKGFCTETGWPQGELNLPRALMTGKAYPEDEYLWEISCTTSEPVAIMGSFTTAKRIGKRHQIEAVLPFGLQQVVYENDAGEEVYRWGEGMGDIALGWKSVVWHSLKGGTIGALAAELIVPSGDEEDELGKGIFIFEPYLAIGQIIPVIGFLQLQVGAELSTDLGKADHELFWRGALGHAFTQGPYGRVIAPMVEILGKAEFADETEVAWDVVPQLFLTLNQRQHLMLGLGAKIPITEFDDRQIEVMAYLLWDWFDGGFFEGW